MHSSETNTNAIDKFKALMECSSKKIAQTCVLRDNKKRIKQDPSIQARGYGADVRLQRMLMYIHKSKSPGEEARGWSMWTSGRKVRILQRKTESTCGRPDGNSSARQMPREENEAELSASP